MVATDDDDTAGPRDSRGRSLKRRRGPAPIAAADRRTHRVSVYLSAAELAALDDLRGGVGRGRYLRNAALDTPPPQIPDINIEAWRSLAPVASNLNQLARRANTGESVDIEAVRADLQNLRAAMIGFVPPADDDGDGGASDEG
jgi:hypothetical protein